MGDGARHSGGTQDAGAAPVRSAAADPTPAGPDPWTPPGAGEGADVPAPGAGVRDAPPAWRPPRSSTATWVLYDMANTVFSFNIVSLYFALWLNQDLDLPDSVFAIGNSVSMAVVFLLAPVLGTLSDRARRRIPFLVASTVACVGATAPLGFFDWPVAIALFAVANIGFQSGLIFYDALLPAVSTRRNRGRVGAVGVGVGYLGSLAGLAIGSTILGRDPAADRWVFLATAGLFLLLALPAFVLVREPPKAQRRLGWRDVRSSAHDAFSGLWRIARGRSIPHVRRFLAGRVLYTDAVNTMIIFLGIYAVEEAGFTESAVQVVVLLGIIGAVLMSFAWGVMVDRIGPKHTLDVVLGLWMFGLSMVVLIGALPLPDPKAAFYPLAFILGACLGGTWSADRPLMVGLVPPTRIGEFYGYYAMVGRFAAIAGPLAWALVVDGLELGRPAAVLTLLGFILLAFLVLRRLPDPEHPGPTPMWPLLPWRRDDGTPAPRVRPWWLPAPAVFVYLAGSSVLFLLFQALYGGDFFQVPAAVDAFFVYRVQDLVDDVPGTLLHLVTAVWANVHWVQFLYVGFLLATFGVWFESHEGPLRTAAVFYAASIVAGIVAGGILLALDTYVGGEWLAAEADRIWVGGSAGANGLLGGIAARARRPWLLLVLFVFWELQVGLWWLQSSTPLFHLTALATGYIIVRRLPPRRAPSGPRLPPP